ncbi:MAG: arginine N-succinyltransferase [Leptospiraceae bacterium]|nr:arginine N-succinyltransferase [Leptospiraceae bacterium]
MLLVRPIRATDLDALVMLAGEASFGLTSLPPDRNLLAERIEKSLRSFAFPARKPGSEMYLFVLEDAAAEFSERKIRGSAAVYAKLGGYEPFYAYDIQTEELHSADLNIHTSVSALTPLIEHDGPSAIGSLFLSPHFRRRSTGRFLSLCRFLFMGLFPEYFEDKVIAEMRGIVDSNGESPLWNAIGRHFFHVDYPRADYLSAVNKAFINDLMPRHPIYMELLPDSARAVIGRVHPNTAPALRILEQEGFQKTGLVDIFDGGPIVSCDTRSLRCVRELRYARIESWVSHGHPPSNDALRFTGPAHVHENHPDHREYLIAPAGNQSEEFRVALSRIHFLDEYVNSDGQPPPVCIAEPVGQTLNLQIGDSIAYVSLRPGEKEA